MGYTLSSDAEQDSEQILTYTFENWGYGQFQKYQKLLLESLEIIGEDPYSVLSRKHTGKVSGYRSIKFGKHLIFYKEVNGDAMVVRVLHQSMDYYSHLG